MLTSLLLLSCWCQLVKLIGEVKLVEKSKKDQLAKLSMLLCGLVLVSKLRQFVQYYITYLQHSLKLIMLNLLFNINQIDKYKNPILITEHLLPSKKLLHLRLKLWGACNLSKEKKPRSLLQALGFCFGTDVVFLSGSLENRCNLGNRIYKAKNRRVTSVFVVIPQ